jgi:hypothetical protein
MRRVVVVLLWGLVIVGLTIYLSNHFFLGDEYRVFPSPDGRFKVVVYSCRQSVGMMPGQGSDAPGNVCLFEVSTGRMLERKRIEMVQLVPYVDWSSTNVYIKLIADWQLP